MPLPLSAVNAWSKRHGFGPVYTGLVCYYDLLIRSEQQKEPERRDLMPAQPKALPDHGTGERR